MISKPEKQALFLPEILTKKYSSHKEINALEIKENRFIGVEEYGIRLNEYLKKSWTDAN